MTNLSLELYRSMFMTLKRGNGHGIFSNAKPLFVITILESIPHILPINRIEITNERFIEKYKAQFKKFKQQILTPFQKPFYHLDSEPFYSLVWKNDIRERLMYSPSKAFIKERILYAKLEDDLWTLLQDEGNREYLKSCIIKYYLS